MKKILPKIEIAQIAERVGKSRALIFECPIFFKIKIFLTQQNHAVSKKFLWKGD